MASDPLPPHRGLFEAPAARTTRRPGCLAPAATALFLAVAFAAGWYLSSRDEPVPAAVRAPIEAVRDALPGGDPPVVDASARVATDLAGIRAAQLARLEQGLPPRALPVCPDADPGRAMLGFGGPCRVAWESLGWTLPDAVPCRYRVVVPEPGDFRVIAECDPDGDGEFDLWIATRDDEPRRWAGG